MPDDNVRWQFQMSDLFWVVTGTGGAIAIIRSMRGIVTYSTDDSAVAGIMFTLTFWSLLARLSGRVAISGWMFGLWLSTAVLLSVVLPRL